LGQQELLEGTVGLAGFLALGGTSLGLVGEWKLLLLSTSLLNLDNLLVVSLGLSHCNTSSGLGVWVESGEDTNIL